MHELGSHAGSYAGYSNLQLHRHTILFATRLLAPYLESSAKVRHGLGRNAHKHFLSVRGKKKVYATQDELEISMRTSDRIRGNGP